MWEEDKKKKLRRSLILIVIILVLTAGLIGAMLYNSKANAEKDEQLKVIYEEQKKAQGEAKQANLNTVIDAYNQDMETVKQYLPGIVCWGDNLTSGSTGGISYPNTLQKLIDENICALYDFRSTIDNADEYNSRVEWKDYKVSIPVVNMGCGQESCDTILGRNGAVPYVTSEDITIPSSCEPVEIKIKLKDGSSVYPLSDGDGGLNDVTINGIQGKLTIDIESYKSYVNNTYYFTRSEPGSETFVESGTEVISGASELYRDYIPVIFMGTYGGYNNVTELIAKEKEIIAHQTNNSDRYIIIGIYATNSGWDTALYNYSAIEAAMAQEFGNHYINLRKYLASDAISDAGLTATSTDKYQMQSGYVPDSLKSGEDKIQLKAVCYELLGKIVYERMDQLGYFDEVTKELGIDEIREDMMLEQIKSSSVS